jgi:TP901 family phage tail tape measure protein
MADVESNINVNIDTSNALAAIKRLQSEISAFHTSMARGGAQAAATSSQLQKELVNSLNATGNFSAGFRNVKSSADAFTTSLEKNKFSLGEYFKYAGASTKTFGKVFQTEMATIDKVARERVKDLQTQYIKLGTEANGAIKTIAIRPLTLDLQDLGTKTAIAAQKQQLFNELMRQGSTNLLNFGKNTQWAGRQLMVGFSIPLGIAGAAAAREFMKLEEQAIRFKRVYGDTFTPSGETDRMVEDIKKLAGAYTTYGIAVEKTMGLAADAAAMGKTGADLLAQVDQASKLAVLGNVDQQEALKTTISLTSAFGTATRDLAKDINFLNAVENQTVTSIEDLTTAIPTAAPVIQQLGGDVQDLTFFLTAMREGGINASEGANALKSGLASMINPTTAATEMLGKFGVNLQGIVDGNKGNVKQMIVDLGLALDGLDPTNRAQAIEQLFGKFQFARMSTLFQNVIKEGSQAGRVLELTARSATELSLLSEREMKKVADSPVFKFQAALEKFQAALAPVGEAFLKLITPIIEWGKQLLDGFNSWGDGAKNFTMLLVGAVAGLGPILLMGFGLIANGAANLIKGLMGLFNFFKRLGGQSKILGEQTKYMSQEQINAMAAAASLEQAHNSLTQAFTSERAAIRQLITAYEQASVAQGRFMSAPVNRGTVGRTAPVKKASGGIISGPGTGTSDSIPAMLSNGEAVIPAKQVAANRSLVEGLIAGNVPGFSKGGIVGNPLLEIFKRFKKSKRSKMPVTDFGELVSPSKGHSFPDFESNPYGNKAMGGLYRKPDGSLVFVKPQMDERGAVAELRATQIAREAHGLKTPQQSLRVMKDPNDEKGQRKVFALESPFDEALANPTGTFTKEEMGKQLVASLLRGDKDLSQSNMYSNVLADVGTSGVFDRASGFRDFAPQMPTMEEQANINLLAVRGGAKRAFAESTADIARSMTPQQYNDMIVSEIDTVLPKLQQTIASFGLTDPEEIAAYQRMVDRLREGRSVDWSRFHGIHSAVQPKPQKLARGTARVTKKPVARGYDFDDTLVNLSSFLPGHREANAKLPKEQRKSWGWEAIKGAAPMPKVIQNLLDSQAAGKKIIIMTARPNTMDPMTTAHLKALGINPKNVKLISRDVADKSLSGLSTAELKAVQAKNVMDEYDLEAFFDDMEDNRNAVAGLGVNVFDPLKFASGSQMVPGTGNKDTVPALLTPGEAVIPKKQAEKYRPLIRGMIAGNLPGFVDGTEDVAGSSNIDLIRSKTSGSAQAAVDKILQYRLRAVAKGVEEEFMARLMPILESAGGKIGVDKFKKELMASDEELYTTINTRAKRDLSADAHIGSGIRVSPEKALEMTQDAPPSVRAVAQAAVTTKELTGTSNDVLIKHGFFFETLQRLNKEMDTVGADITELLTDFETRGPRAWAKSIELGGEVFEDLEEETRKYHEDIATRLRNARAKGVEKIVDTEEQAIALRQQGIKAESMESHVSAARANLPEGSRVGRAFDKAENTAYQVRYALGVNKHKEMLRQFPEGTEEGDRIRRDLKAAQLMTPTGPRSTTSKISTGTPFGAIDPSLPSTTKEDIELRKVAKRAAKKIVKDTKQDVAEAVEESVEKRAENASPSKRGGRAGDDIVDGIMGPVEEASKRAKTAGTRMADRVVNTNPAFGRVPQVAPVVSGSMKAFIEQQSKKMMSSGAIATLLASASPIQKLNGDFSIMGTNIKNMSAQLQLARSPITMLEKAATATKNGLITAGQSVKDFGINAANGAKAFAQAAVDAAVKFGQGAKQMIVNAPAAMSGFYGGVELDSEGRPVLDEQGNKKYTGMRGKIIEGGNKFGGKVAGAGMGIGMAAMMASSMGGPVGEIANQLSGPIMAISSIAGIFQMFPGILAAMTGPIGLVVAGLAAAGVGLYMMYDQLIKTREAAKQAAEATAISNSNMNAFAETAGTLSPTEVIRKQNESARGSDGKQLTFGDAYLEQEAGQKLKAGLQTAIKETGKSQAVQDMSNQLATAVTAGLITAVQASEIADALGQSLNDKSISVQLIGEVTDLIGPNGEDITKSPVEVSVKLVEQTGEKIGQSLSVIKNTGMASWGSAEWNAMVAAEQEAAVGFESIVTQSQLLLDNLELQHQRRLEELESLGDTAGIIAENNKYEENKASLIKANNKSLQDQLDLYNKLPKENQAAILQSSGTSLTDQYKGTELEAVAGNVVKALSSTQSIYTNTKGNQESLQGKDISEGNKLTLEQYNEKVASEKEAYIKANPNAQGQAFSQTETEFTAGPVQQALSGETQLKLTTNIQAGNIDVAQFEKLTSFMDPGVGGNAAVYSAIANVSANISGAAAGQLTSLLSEFGEGNEAAAIKISAEIENLNPEEAQTTLDAYTALQGMGEDGVNLVIAAQIDPSAEKKLKSYTDRYKKIQDLTANGPITMQMVIDSDPEGFAALEGQTEYFNSLPAAQQKIFLERYLTVRETVTGDEAMRYLKENKIEKKGGYAGSVQQYSESQMNEARGALAAQGAQEFMQGLGDFADTGDGDGGSGGGGSSEPPPRTIADVIADQQKRITAIGDQTTAVRKLTAAGLSLADAYAIAANAEDAALIAHGATAEQIAELTAKTREAEKATKDLAAAQSVANTAMDTKEKNALATRLAADSSLTDIQKRFLLDNSDAARLYMTPTFDPEALRQALLDAQNSGTYEFNINRVTIPGLQEIWKKGISNAAEAFSAQENAIEVTFKAQEGPFKDIIEASQRAIQDIQNRPGGLDDLDADLQRISYKEEDINKAYENKLKALDAIGKSNDKLIAQQKAQLTIADALSQGDIASAAKAAQDMRAQQASSAVSSEREAIEANRKLELDAIMSNGMTREQIEARIKELKQEILEIEEKQLEPAQRQLELLDRIKQDQIDALVVLGKTKDEWDAINSSLELANTKTKEFQDAMREALTIATTLGTALATGVVPTVGSMPTPTTPTAPSAPARAAYSYPGVATWGSNSDVVKKLQSALNTGGAGLAVDGEFGPLTAKALKNFQSSNGLVADAVAGPLTWKKLYDVQYFNKGGQVAYMNKGGKMSYMALGGMAKMFAKGTDTIPAMLSAGEFVMQKSAVDKIGAGRLAELNRGYDKNTNNSSDSVYNYSINVNVSGSNSNADDIAKVVLQKIKGIDNQKLRSNKF